MRLGKHRYEQLTTYKGEYGKYRNCKSNCANYGLRSVRKNYNGHKFSVGNMFMLWQKVS